MRLGLVLGHGGSLGRLAQRVRQRVAVHLAPTLVLRERYGAGQRVAHCEIGAAYPVEKVTCDYLNNVFGGFTV